VYIPTLDEFCLVYHMRHSSADASMTHMYYQPTKQTSHYYESKQHHKCHVMIRTVNKTKPAFSALISLVWQNQEGHLLCKHLLQLSPKILILE